MMYDVSQNKEEGICMFELLIGQYGFDKRKK